jgi:CTP synthase
MKYILVTGGVISGLGKGISTSSLGRLLKACGIRVTAIKIDPYLNTDAGTMSPYEHGEVYVLGDGGEVDLDLGNYERFLDIQLTREHNITTGKVYQQVISRERKGDYLGKTVQVIPHLTDAIQDWICKVAKIPVDGTQQEADVCLIELGGTVGDIEGMVFLEAARQLRSRVGDNNFCHVHVSLVPKVGEQKSKPTQHGVRELRAVGLTPDFIFCRCPEPVLDSVKKKIAQFCMVPFTNVISMHQVTSTYTVPKLLMEQNVASLVMKKLNFCSYPDEPVPDLGAWNDLLQSLEEAKKPVSIGIIGKYTGLEDAYLSLTKALIHASLAQGIALKIEWIESTELETKSNRSAWNALKRCDGILIPGGFGERGSLGKMNATQYSRENKIPFLGICLGFQIAVIEYCRNVLGWKDACSQEFSHKGKHVIIFMPEISTSEMGGTMRLGSHRTLMNTDCLASKMYGKEEIIERHRHRYEVNPEYRDQITNGTELNFTGKDTTGRRMEILEMDVNTHPFFFGTQYHPEFLSRPLNPSPVFVHFLAAASKKTGL